MSQKKETPIQPADLGTTTCDNCKAPMPLGLRFCRNCGYRLGEGVAEYTETERFERPTATDNGAASQSYDTTYGVGGGPLAASATDKMKKRAKKISGVTWMFIGLLVFFISAAIFTAVVTPGRFGGPPPVSVPAPRSLVGVDAFENADGGVTFGEVDIPDGPADKAGLVGGDIITIFDGKVIMETDDITDLLRETPIGKTVEVTYIRDGETRKTKLTTISREETRRLAREFDNRPEGKGFFGFETSRTERVAIEGTKLFGVRLNALYANRPADMAGIKEGDIVIEFGDVPIRTRDELSARVRRAIPYSTVDVVVIRGKERLKIPVKIGKS